MFGGEWTERTLDIVTAMPSRGAHRGRQRRVVGLPVQRDARRADWRRGHHRGWRGGHADVAPDTIVGGNLARPIRRRFDDADLDRLRRGAWWDWPSELVTEHVRTIMAGTLADIEHVAAEHRLEKTP
jgi:virginiamycin A acetyltransferase